MSTPYLYQTLHVRGRKALWLERHVELLNTAARELFGRGFAPSPGELEERIAELLDAGRYPATGSSFVRMELLAEGEWRLQPGAVSLYDGYGLRSVRPGAIVVEYDLPLSDHPTSAREAAAQWAALIAREAGCGVAIRSDSSGIVHSCDDAPLFAVKGEYVYASPAAVPGVEREVALKLIDKARLYYTEQPVGREQLPLFDELFYFDHRGITSLRGCLNFATEGISDSGRGIFSRGEGGAGVPAASEPGGKSTESESEIPRMVNSKQPLSACEGAVYADIIARRMAKYL